MISSRWVSFPHWHDFGMKIILPKWEPIQGGVVHVGMKKYIFLSHRNKTEEIWQKLPEITERAPLLPPRCDRWGRSHTGVMSVSEIRAVDRAYRLRLITHTDLEGVHKHTHAHGVGMCEAFHVERFEVGEAYISPQYHVEPASGNLSLFFYLSHSRMNFQSTDYCHLCGAQKDRRSAVCM